MKKTLLLLIALYVLFTFSCKKDIVAPTETDSRLIGQWIWQKSSGGFAGTTNTPQSAGYTQSIEFTSNSIYIRKKNGIEVERRTYSLSQEKSIFKEEKVDMIKYGSAGINQVIEYLKNDTLRLSDNCYDCFGHEYVRLK